MSRGVKLVRDVKEEGDINEELNLYAFVGNDPVNRWDYLGLFLPDCFQADVAVLRVECSRSSGVIGYCHIICEGIAPARIREAGAEHLEGGVGTCDPVEECYEREMVSEIFVNINVSVTFSRAGCTCNCSGLIWGFIRFYEDNKKECCDDD